LAEPDCSVLYVDFYPIIVWFSILSSLLGENEEFEGAVTDL